MSQYLVNNPPRFLAALCVALLFAAGMSVTAMASESVPNVSSEESLLGSVDSDLTRPAAAKDNTLESLDFQESLEWKSNRPLSLLELCSPLQWQQCAPGTLSCTVENRNTVLCDGIAPC